MNKNIKPRGSHSHSINVIFLKLLKSSQENDGRLAVLPEVISIAEQISEHLVTPDSKTQKVSLFSYFFLSWGNLLKYIFEEPQAVSGTLLFNDLYERWISVYFFSSYMNFFFPQMNIKKQTVLLFRDQQGET